MEGASCEREGVTTGSSNLLWRAFSFLLRQTGDIRRGGVTILLRKVGRAISPAGLLLLLPLVVLIRVLRPLVLIRFGPLQSERIGHFAANTELYLCERDAGLQDPKAIDIFYHASQISNAQLKTMWDRTLHISSLARWLDWANRILPGGKKHIIVMPSDRDVHGLFNHMQVHLSFTSQEKRAGRENIRRLGISDGDPFVCFLSRSVSYLDNAFPKFDSRYHHYRNSSIKNFVPAAEELVRRGYYAVRTGAFEKEPLNSTNLQIIDYAMHGRTEFLDIYLGAKCRFYIGDSCGFHAVPMVFRRPLVIVNMVPLEYLPTWGANCLFIPKKLWLQEEGRFMTFREILDSGTGRFLKGNQYEEHGIGVVENTPEEITSVAVEMDERLKEIWKTNEEDERLQQSFWSLFRPSHLNGVFHLRIGAEFLRENRELLE